MPSVEKDNSYSASAANMAETAKTKASQAASAVANHPMTQSVANGPVMEKARVESSKTQAEFSNLAASRQTPETPAATGQQLTHYHSFFSSLLSWNNPRASGIAYASIVTFIFAARYLDILRYAFKLTWMTLGITVLAEVAGKAVLSHGLASQFRPKKYFTISKSTLDSLTGDFSELVNFFVIESQRIVFAENLLASVAAFLGAFISYYLIKVVPFWGMSLISATVLFVTPLVYKTNKEVIDHYIAQATEIVNQQSKQVRDMAAQQASRASETTKQYVGDYSSKAQELIGNARARSISPTAVKSEPALKNEDFPNAPSEEFKSVPSVGESANSLKSDEPLVKSDEPLIAA